VCRSAEIATRDVRLAEGNLMPGASSQCEAGWPNSAGRYDGRGVDHGSPAELSRATRLSRPARLVSDQRHFVALLYTLSRDTTKNLSTSFSLTNRHPMTRLDEF